MELLLLVGVLLLALLLVPLGLPGTWIMVGVGGIYNSLVGVDRIGTITIVGTALLALAAELVEFALSGRMAKRYGGSRRAGWGAMIGGMVGAIVGFPVPVIGPMIGAFAGAFAGALLFELTLRGDTKAATKVAIGALIGRVAAVAVKVAVGCVIVAWLVAAAWA